MGVRGGRPGPCTSQSPFRGVRGAASILRGGPGPRPPARPPAPPRPPPAQGRRVATPHPDPGKKSFQTPLLAADWPRRTRSRGAAANGGRGPRAQGPGRGPEVPAAPPSAFAAASAASAAAAAARPRRLRSGECGAAAAAAAGAEGCLGAASAAGKLFCPRPAARCAPGPPLAAAVPGPRGSPRLLVASWPPGLWRSRALGSKFPLPWNLPRC